MTIELGRALAHLPQLELDVRAIFRMTLAEFLDSDLLMGMVIVHRLVGDTGTMLGARLAGWSQPMSQVEMFSLAAHAAAMNDGRPKGVKPIIPIWPWPDPSEAKKTRPARDVSDEERRRLKAILDAHSAIPEAVEDGGES